MSSRLYDKQVVVVPRKLEAVSMYGRTCLVSTWFSTYSWIVSAPRSVPVYTSCT